jgi:hypothetical protein
MWLALALSALLISVVPAPPALAQRTFDANTPCGRFVDAAEAGDHSAIRAARSYVLDVMEARDAEYVARSQGDMMGAMNANGRTSLISAVETYCRGNPERPLGIAAVRAYDDARAMLGQMGRPR